ELVARIRARLRRPAAVQGCGAAKARFAGWTADFDRYMLTAPDGAQTPLSHAEAEVLRLFTDHPRRLITRAQMLETLGGAAGDSFDRAMDVRISRLRNKLCEDPKNPRLIKTIYGAGYIFLAETS
ncbi:MAG TPA: response regulator transcription factor, partial [Paracoccus sp.]|nr:response regulator transcription factor [Paracoccus sp. (in: a-proteobacteria)]